jgi:hypothetical protein
MHVFAEADLQAAKVPVWKSIEKNCRSSVLYQYYRMLCHQLDVTQGAELYKAEDNFFNL